MGGAINPPPPFTPNAGAAPSPIIGTPPIAGGGAMAAPRPAPAAAPGPPGAFLVAAEFGPGPSTVMETMFSPRRMTNPSLRRSSRSTTIPASFFLPFVRRNSDVSESTMFMCLSNAMNVPTRLRESAIVILIRAPTCCSSLDDFPPELLVDIVFVVYFFLIRDEGTTGDLE